MGGGAWGIISQPLIYKGAQSGEVFNSFITLAALGSPKQAAAIACESCLCSANTTPLNSVPSMVSGAGIGSRELGRSPYQAIPTARR